MSVANCSGNSWCRKCPQSFQTTIWSFGPCGNVSPPRQPPVRRSLESARTERGISADRGNFRRPTGGQCRQRLRNMCRTPRAICATGAPSNRRSCQRRCHGGDVSTYIRAKIPSAASTGCCRNAAIIGATVSSVYPYPGSANTKAVTSRGTRRQGLRRRGRPSNDRPRPPGRSERCRRTFTASSASTFGPKGPAVGVDRPWPRWSTTITRWSAAKSVANQIQSLPSQAQPCSINTAGPLPWSE